MKEVTGEREKRGNAIGEGTGSANGRGKIGEKGVGLAVEETGEDVPGSGRSTGVDACGGMKNDVVES